MGHYLAAIINGFDAQIHYSYTTSTINPTSEATIYFYYILAGPISTWAQCLIPFFLLLIFYNKNRREKIVEKQFFDKDFIIYLFFISMAGRFLFNAMTYIFTRSKSIDEYKMADYLMIHPETFLILFAVIALLIFFIAIYKIPKNKRISTVLGAMIGSIIGYSLWNFIFGPIILP
ncbi:MAG: hypothetical protein ACFFBZ_13940 [Promethearchaeota archaeon]